MCKACKTLETGRSCGRLFRPHHFARRKDAGCDVWVADVLHDSRRGLLQHQGHQATRQAASRSPVLLAGLFTCCSSCKGR